MHLADAKIIVATHRRVFLAPGVVASTDIVLSPPQPTAGACRPSIPDPGLPTAAFLPAARVRGRLRR